MADKTMERRRERTEWWPDLIPRRWLDWMDWPALEGRLGEHAIRVEQLEEDGQLVVRAEMPGMDPEKDVQVNLRDHTLEIRAQRTQEETKDEKGTHRSEFHYGSFYRAVTLPHGAKESDVQASYKDGILEIRVPMEAAAETDSTRIPVKHD